MDRTILHCDLNSFFASVELLAYPDLRSSGAAVAVCGDPKTRRGVILAKNEPAKAAGVKTAETIWQAQKKCPGLVLLPAHHNLYEKYSKIINEIYNRFTDLVEPFSIDESWLDVSGSMHLWNADGKGIADLLRYTVEAETGLTISVGVSYNKIFAKMGSDYKKPNATTVITRENYRDLLWPLPVTDLMFVGKAAAKTLGGYGVKTIGDLAAFDPAALVTLLGKQGATLSHYANGIDPSPVAPANTYSPPKSVGCGLTFKRDLLGAEDIRTGVAVLADEVAGRLRRHGLKCSTVQVTIRDPYFKDICRQKRLSAPSYVSRDISDGALELISAAWNLRAPIRALTITGQNLMAEAEASEQMDLFSANAMPQRDKLERLEHTVDKIRDKFGGNAITFASAVKGALGVDEDKQEED
ncbi:MAG: DNA polymerase IV [Pseudoflavonifractor sp.]